MVWGERFRHAVLHLPLLFVTVILLAPVQTRQMSDTSLGFFCFVLFKHICNPNRTQGLINKKLFSFHGWVDTSSLLWGPECVSPLWQHLFMDAMFDAQIPYYHRYCSVCHNRSQLDGSCWPACLDRFLSVFRTHSLGTLLNERVS